MKKKSESFVAMKDIVITLPIEAKGGSKEPPYNASYCSSCSRWFASEDCPREQEYESWEQPQRYWVDLCPVCEDGGMVDDYTVFSRWKLAFLRFRLRIILLLKTLLN